ncbi:hypothetical protein C7B82_01835 [Stenomitos frigidus ULC18]|uniref:Uncharacterized protein n=1 Tax=Stenomitos frigidus ULC18 TaxID=2107698 RepID=A0A2T1EPM7_9CYAN|nr:hypothetical protein C7B82_01835 [Stenomitos frigidus ULC18]
MPSRSNAKNYTVVQIAGRLAFVKNEERSLLVRDRCSARFQNDPLKRDCSPSDPPQNEPFKSTYKP